MGAVSHVTTVIFTSLLYTSHTALNNLTGSRVRQEITLGLEGLPWRDVAQSSHRIYHLFTAAASQSSEGTEAARGMMRYKPRAATLHFLCSEDGLKYPDISLGVRWASVKLLTWYQQLGITSLFADC